MVGWIRRMLGHTELTDNLIGSIGRNSRLMLEPTHDDLMEEAKRRKGHISMKAVSDEYERLVLSGFDSDSLSPSSRHRPPSPALDQLRIGAPD